MRFFSFTKKPLSVNEIEGNCSRDSEGNEAGEYYEIRIFIQNILCIA